MLSSVCTDMVLRSHFRIKFHNSIKKLSYIFVVCCLISTGVFKEDLSRLGAVDLKKGKGRLNLKYCPTILKKLRLIF